MGNKKHREITVDGIDYGWTTKSRDISIEIGYHQKIQKTKKIKKMKNNIGKNVIIDNTIIKQNVTIVSTFKEQAFL